MTNRYEKHVVVDCDFTDQLEAWATTKTHLEFKIKKEDHVHEDVRGHIADIFAKDHVDHLRLSDGRVFDLSQIVGVKVLA
jgi:hypothetical protein